MPSETIRRLYVASSWRNPRYAAVAHELQTAGFSIADWRLADPFEWTSIDPEWERWTVEQYRAGLAHPLAERGFKRDVALMESADACVLLHPCGNSAHIEAGWFWGRGKPVFILLGDYEFKPDLMYRDAAWIGQGIPSLVEALQAFRKLQAFRRLAASRFDPETNRIVVHTEVRRSGAIVRTFQDGSRRKTHKDGNEFWYDQDWRLHREDGPAGRPAH